MADEGKSISFDELVKVRKDEMEGMLPGLYAEITMGNKSKKVYSPRAFEKSSLRIRGVSSDD